MGSLQNLSPALLRSQSSLRRTALCVVVLAVSFLACLYLKTPLQTAVKNSDVFSSQSPVFPPRRRLTWVTDKFDSLKARAKSVDINTSIREYIEGRYLTQLSLNGTIDANVFKLICYYADADAVEGIHVLMSGDIGLVCSTAKIASSSKIQFHTHWTCVIDMARNKYFIPNNSVLPPHSGKPAWQRLDMLPPPPHGLSEDSPFGNITLSKGSTVFSGFLRGIAYNCYVGD